MVFSASNASRDPARLLHETARHVGIYRPSYDVIIRAHAHNNLLLKCFIYYHFYLIFCLQVLDKFPVAQHFPFGTILSIEPATAAPTKE